MIIPDEFELGTSSYLELEFLSTKSVGAGSFGTVWKAKWRNQLVAVKEMKDVTASAFSREVSALLALSHPNITKLFYTCKHMPNATPCIIMEFLEGGSLEQYLHGQNLFGFFRHEDYTFLHVQRWLRQIADAVKFLHENDIIHRDLKTANILLTGDHQAIKVCDFGLATKPAPTLTSSRGTPSYMAPEVFESNGKYSLPCDIFSLGIIIWELLSRRIPYTIRQPDGRLESKFGLCHNLYIAVSRGERPDRLLSRHIPAALLDLMEQCYQQIPANRPTAAEVADRMERLQRTIRNPAETTILIELPVPLMSETNSTAAHDASYNKTVNQMAELTRKFPAEITALMLIKNCNALMDKLETLENSTGIEVDRLRQYSALFSSLLDAHQKFLRSSQSPNLERSDVYRDDTVLQDVIDRYSEASNETTSNSELVPHITIHLIISGGDYLTLNSQKSTSCVRLDIMAQPARQIFQELHEAAVEDATSVQRTSTSDAFLTAGFRLIEALKILVENLSSQQTETEPICPIIVEIIDIICRHELISEKYFEACETTMELLTNLSNHETKFQSFWGALPICLDVLRRRDGVILFGYKFANYLYECTRCPASSTTLPAHFNDIWRIIQHVLHAKNARSEVCLAAKLLEVIILNHPLPMQSLLGEIIPDIFQLLMLFPEKQFMVTRHRLILVLMAALHISPASSASCLMNLRPVILAPTGNDPLYFVPPFPDETGLTYFARFALKNLELTSGPWPDKMLMIFGLLELLNVVEDGRVTPKILPAILLILKRLLDNRHLTLETMHDDPDEAKAKDYDEYKPDVVWTSTLDTSPEVVLSRAADCLSRLKQNRVKWNVLITDLRKPQKTILMELFQKDGPRSDLTSKEIKERGPEKLPKDHSSDGDQGTPNRILEDIPIASTDSTTTVFVSCTKILKDYGLDHTRHLEFMLYKLMSACLTDLLDILLDLPATVIDEVIFHLALTFDLALKLEAPVNADNSSEKPFTASDQEAAESAGSLTDKLHDLHSLAIEPVIVRLLAQMLIFNIGETNCQFLDLLHDVLELHEDLPQKLHDFCTDLVAKTEMDRGERDFQFDPSTFWYDLDGRYCRAGRSILMAITAILEKVNSRPADQNAVIQVLVCRQLFNSVVMHNLIHPYSTEIFQPLAALIRVQVTGQLWNGFDICIDLLESNMFLGWKGFHSESAICFYYYATTGTSFFSAENHLKKLCFLCLDVINAKEDQLISPAVIPFSFAAKLLEVLIQQHYEAIPALLSDIVRHILPLSLREITSPPDKARTRCLLVIVSAFAVHPELTVKAIKQPIFLRAIPDKSKLLVFFRTLLEEADSETVAETSEMKLVAAGLLTLFRNLPLLNVELFDEIGREVLPVIIDILLRLRHKYSVPVMPLAVDSGTRTAWMMSRLAVLKTQLDLSAEDIELERQELQKITTMLQDKSPDIWQACETALDDDAKENLADLLL